ncbi:MAG TPA: hypothetical protein VF516_37020, partial [Kofleriaceae bacterium]
MDSIELQICSRPPREPDRTCRPDQPGMRVTAIQGPIATPALRASAREPTLAQQLDALLTDVEFHKLIEAVTAEVVRRWNVPRRTAAGLVMSAVGEPGTLHCVHRAWFLAETRGSGARLAKLIVRRRVFDLLRADARRPLHTSLPRTSDEIDGALRALDGRIDRDSHAQAELHAVASRVRAALECFARQGPCQARQACLVRRHALDEIDRLDLAAQLACSQNALRVRIHKALRALRKHIEACH